MLSLLGVEPGEDFDAEYTRAFVGAQLLAEALRDLKLIRQGLTSTSPG